MKRDNKTADLAVASGAGTQCWYRITGLPGWKRRQMGLPAFGSLGCVPHGAPSGEVRPKERADGK